MSTTGALADAAPPSGDEGPDLARDAEPRTPVDRTFAIGLAVVMAVGLAIRVAFVAIRQSKVRLTTGDAYWYHWQAHLVATGHGFLNPFDYYKNHVSSP